jgi:endo-1,4-beta-xylanase
LIWVASLRQSDASSRAARASATFFSLLVLCLAGVSCSRPMSTAAANGGSGGGTSVGGMGGQGTGGTGPAGLDGGSGLAGSGGKDAGTGGAATGGSGTAGSLSGGSGGGGTALGGATAARDAGTDGAAGAGGSRDIDADDRREAGPDVGSDKGRAAPEAGAKLVGNITTKEQADPAGLVYSDYWDQITPDHAGAWAAVQSSPGGAFKWSVLDAIYAYSQEKGIIFNQYFFIGGMWQPGQPASKIAESDVRSWMRAFCERYPQTKVIDVVTEPLHNPPHYADSIGGGTDGDWKWITNAFAWARDACPSAILLLDDYSIIQNAEENLRIINLVKTIKAAGAPIDAIGAQAWDTADAPTSTIRGLLERLNEETGLPIYITAYEVDRKDDNEQLRIYQSQFPLFWDAQYVRGITLWGWMYASTGWNGWLVKETAQRPAMTWLMQYLGRAPASTTSRLSSSSVNR